VEEAAHALASWLMTGQIVGAERGGFLTGITLLPMVLAALVRLVDAY
jgi:hypothetical protein